MKKRFYLTLAVLISASLYATAGCNQNTPGFGQTPGTVSFLTPKTWTVGNQIWSDVVIASNCQKTTFAGINESDTTYNADCRHNPGFGDLFSWCAIQRFQNILCPAPWRVPSAQDFVDLDIALGGDGTNRSTPSPELALLVAETYLNPKVWGGTQGGFSNPVGGMQHVGTGSLYWSSTEVNAANAYYMNFSQNGRVRPRLPFNKGFGFVLRCVR